MTYSAPRQGIFAIIMLASLGLHLLFFVISSEHQSNKNNQIIAEKTVEELMSALSVPLATEDRVSMSVVANNYAKHPEISFVGIYDTKNNLIVSVGNEQSGGYRTKNTSISSGDKLLGAVAVEMKVVNRALILSQQWIFLLTTLALHLLVWLAYTFMARPSSELKEQITKDVRANLLTQGLLGEETTKREASDTDFQSVEADGVTQTVSIDVETSVKSESNHSDASYFDDYDKDKGSMYRYVTQICFHDPNRLMDAVSFDTKQAYFALCNQLLEKSVEKLLEQPLLKNVQIHHLKSFDDTGAVIEFAPATLDHDKPATAALMLAQLMLMVNEIVYRKHRDIGRFALTMRAMASDVSQMNSVHTVSARRNLQLVLLFDQAAKAEIIPFFHLKHLEKPASVAERECQLIDAMTNSTAIRLRNVCGRVLRLQE